MIEFTICKDFNGRRDRIWELVKDVSLIPEFWKGTRQLNVVEKSNGVYEGEVKFAFPSKGKIRIEIDEEKKTLKMIYLSGPIKGLNTITVGESTICSQWNVKLTFPFNLRSNWIKDHFMSGTEHALERIISTSKNQLVEKK